MVSLCGARSIRMARLRASGVFSGSQSNWRYRHGRSDLSGDRRRGFSSLCRACRCIKEDVSMWLNILWGAGALVIAAYMLAALLRPERF
ncbi:potassium-transporting ATPase subunit F [Brevundimonas sp.]|uniref:potassium-transporting ATPase subunit F n=1 Tax=Brevundimonas sp. TaxID=1871086 RepID=UPI003FA5B381